MNVNTIDIDHASKEPASSSEKVEVTGYNPLN